MLIWENGLALHLLNCKKGVGWWDWGSGQHPGTGQVCPRLGGTRQSREGGLLVAGVAVARWCVSWHSEAETSAHPSAAFPGGSQPVCCLLHRAPMVPGGIWDF